MRVRVIVRCSAEIFNDNKKEYYKNINGSIDTSEYLTAKKYFYKKSLCLMCQRHAGESAVKKPSEEILGNLLTDLERSGKIRNLKGTTKTTLLNNGY